MSGEELIKVRLLQALTKLSKFFDRGPPIWDKDVAKYEFSYSGGNLSTLKIFKKGLTENELLVTYTFGYDASGNLTSITSRWERMDGK